MEILLLVAAWLLVGCGVAWMIGSAASMSDVTAAKHTAHHDAVGNIDHCRVGERESDGAANELRPLAPISGDRAASNQPR
jgi:hypothetical protein